MVCPTVYHVNDRDTDLAATHLAATRLDTYRYLRKGTLNWCAAVHCTGGEHYQYGLIYLAATRLGQCPTIGEKNGR
jgi:hypothetical protein